MSYENLDVQDKAICEAMEGGMEDAQIMEEFNVTEEKLEQLRPVVAEAGEAVPAGSNDDSASVASLGASPEAEVTPEEEVAEETIAEANDEGVDPATAETIGEEILG